MTSVRERATRRSPYFDLLSSSFSSRSSEIEGEEELREEDVWGGGGREAENEAREGGEVSPSEDRNLHSSFRNNNRGFRGNAFEGTAWVNRGDYDLDSNSIYDSSVSPRDDIERGTNGTATAVTPSRDNVGTTARVTNGFLGTSTTSWVSPQLTSNGIVTNVTPSRGDFGTASKGTNGTVTQITPSRVIPHMPTSSVLANLRHPMRRQSAPVNVPDWSKVFGSSMTKKPVELEDPIFDEVEDGLIVPPHEIMAREYSQSVTFSVYEGVGRTLRGRDLTGVRTAVLRQTGFLDA